MMEMMKPTDGKGFPPREMDGYKIVMEKCVITKKKFEDMLFPHFSQFEDLNNNEI